MVLNINQYSTKEITDVQETELCSESQNLRPTPQKLWGYPNCSGTKNIIINGKPPLRNIACFYDSATYLALEPTSNPYVSQCAVDENPRIRILATLRPFNNQTFHLPNQSSQQAAVGPVGSFTLVSPTQLAGRGTLGSILLGNPHKWCGMNNFWLAIWKLISVNLTHQVNAWQTDDRITE